MTRDRIVSVRAHLIPPADPSDEGDLLKKGGWLTAHIASPLSKYPEFAANRGSGINSALLGGIIVEVESESGTIGVASGGGGFAAAAIIEGHFARLIEGEKASAHGRIWDRMYSASLHYGRKGLTVHAISAVDLAIWDLHGKLLGEPVHELIGGKVRESSRMYATGPRSDLAEELGFVAAKLPLPYGPPHGDDGFERNLETARKARAAISADFPLLYDCWMSLDVPYTLRLMDAIEPLGVRWVEEPLVPDDYAGFRRLAERANRRVLITSGEHEYTAAGFRLLLETGACTIVQPDLQWCGGLTELLKISALAQGFGVPVVPHCGGMYAYHFTVTRSDIDLAEFPIVSPDGDRIVPIHAPYLVGEPAPAAGRFDPGDAPGFGLELDRSLPLVRPFDQENWPGLGAS